MSLGEFEIEVSRNLREEGNYPDQEVLDKAKPFLHKLKNSSQNSWMTKTSIFPSWVSGNLDSEN